ncbi:MAG TPA: hypothetical protein VGF49_15600, partial [Candidatus Solibacter sp.]
MPWVDLLLTDPHQFTLLIHLAWSPPHPCDVGRLAKDTRGKLEGAGEQPVVGVDVGHVFCAGGVQVSETTVDRVVHASIGFTATGELHART